MLSWLLKPFTAVSALAVGTVSLLSRKYERVRLYYHLGLYLSILGATSVWGVVLSIVATASGQRLNINYYVARSFYHVCSPAIGIKIEVEGREHLDQLEALNEGKKQCAVIVGNHQSVLDILYLGRILPKRVAMMAKKELYWYPLLGQFMALSGAVFINRQNRQSAVDIMAKAGKEMKRKGVSLWVFPEGTRSSAAESKILPFKKGAFHLAVQAQVPIVPVVCENYHRLFDGRTRMNPGTLRIRVLPPISTTGLGPDDVTALTESTHDQMLATLKEISHPHPSESKAQSPPRLAGPSAESGPESELDVGISGLARQPSGSENGEEGSSDGHGTKDSSDGTEDEMDEDAVLLKRPSELPALR